MKFITWLKSLFIPTECKVETPSKNDTLRLLMERGVSSLEMNEYLASGLWCMLTSPQEETYPGTKKMSSQEYVMYVIEQFKKDYPDVGVHVSEHTDRFVIFSITFSGKEVNFRADYEPLSPKCKKVR